MKNKELTFEEFCQVPLQHTMGISYDWGSHRMYRNEELGLQKQVITKRKRKGDIYSGWKDGVAAYFLDRDERQFDTPDQVYVAYMEKVCGVTA